MSIVHSLNYFVDPRQGPQLKIQSQGNDGKREIKDSAEFNSFRRHDLHHPICAAKFDQIGIQYVKPTSYINEALIVGLSFAHVPEYFHDKVGRFGNQITGEEWFRKATPAPEGFSNSIKKDFMNQLSTIFHLSAKLGNLMKESGLEQQFFKDLTNSYHAGLDFNLQNNEILFLRDSDTGLAHLEVKAAAEFDPIRYKLYKPVVDAINMTIQQISQNPILSNH